MYDVGRCLLPDILARLRMSQQDLATIMGVTRQQINDYCTGKNIMTLPVAINIALVLGCDIKDLYEWFPVEVRTKRR